MAETKVIKKHLQQSNCLEKDASYIVGRTKKVQRLLLKTADLFIFAIK